jgi:hypothetical protein
MLALNGRHGSFGAQIPAALLMFAQLPLQLYCSICVISALQQGLAFLSRRFLIRLLSQSHGELRQPNFERNRLLEPSPAFDQH